MTAVWTLIGALSLALLISIAAFAIDTESFARWMGRRGR